MLKQIIDEKGKLFGLINPVDLVVILILFGLGIKIIWDYRPAPLMLKEHQVTMGLLVKNIPPYLAKSVTVGQDVFQDGTNAYLGKIKSKKTAPAEVLVDNDGKLILVQSPQGIDLSLELQRSGEILTGSSRNGIFLGKLAVRVGNRLQAHTLFSSIQGAIEYIKVNQ